MYQSKVRQGLQDAASLSVTLDAVYSSSQLETYLLVEAAAVNNI